MHRLPPVLPPSFRPQEASPEKKIGRIARQLNFLRLDVLQEVISKPALPSEEQSLALEHLSKQRRQTFG